MADDVKSRARTALQDVLYARANGIEPPYPLALMNALLDALEAAEARELAIRSLCVDYTPDPGLATGEGPAVSLEERIAEVLRRAGVLVPNDFQYPYATYEQKINGVAAEVVKALGLTEERRVVTPQGTSRAVRPDEQLGDRLRDLGWWTESRSLTEWVRDA